MLARGIDGGRAQRHHLPLPGFGCVALLSSLLHSTACEHDSPLHWELVSRPRARHRSRPEMGADGEQRWGTARELVAGDASRCGEEAPGEEQRWGPCMMRRDAERERIGIHAEREGRDAERDSYWRHIERLLEANF